jgi:hypothetical protein
VVWSFIAVLADNIFWSTGVAAIFGAIGIGAAFISAIVGYGISDFVQAESNTRIAEADARGKEAGEEAAKANERTEELRNANLQLEAKLLEMQKEVRGREITGQQHDRVIAAMEGRRPPELVTYIARDPEATWYGLSIATNLFQELGMKGQVIFLQDQPPLQTGVMYCGTGTDEDIFFMKVLMDAGIVGVGSPDSSFGHDKDAKKIVLPYCPPGSVFVGTKPVLTTFRPKRTSRRDQ